MMGLVWRVGLFGPQGSVPSWSGSFKSPPPWPCALQCSRHPSPHNEAPHLGLASWFPVLDLTLAFSLDCTALAFGCRLLSDFYLLPATQNLYPDQHGTRVLAWAHWLLMALEVPGPRLEGLLVIVFEFHGD